MTFFPSPRHIIKRISGFSKRLLGISKVNRVKTVAPPADLPPETKNREERLKRLQEDRSKFKKKMKKVREVYQEEDEELKEIEEGRHEE